MGFRLADLKKRSRLALHGAMAVDAVYRAPGSTEGKPVTVRWHNKLASVGGDMGDDYATILTGIDRLVFNATNLTDRETPVVLEQDGTVEIADYGLTFALDQAEALDGPENVPWTVVKQ